MLLIYTKEEAIRLQYIAEFVFEDLLNGGVQFTTDAAEFEAYEGERLNYSEANFGGNLLTIIPQGILHEQNIASQIIEWKTVAGEQVFFANDKGSYPFDILAASFYLLTRYEEYLPFTPDSYGRFPHEASAAFKAGLLQEPLINRWAVHFAKAIQTIFPAFTYQLPAFRFTPTYDIDIAYSYKAKGFWRNVGGFLKQPNMERLHVLTGEAADPFDCYDWLNELHDRYQLVPKYFFLIAGKNKGYDKNILPGKSVMQELIRAHAAKYTIGLHPSWQSGDQHELLLEEKNQLAELSETSVSISRQHYIRFNLPEDYRRLLSAGITDDYSMGYGSINGFRASVANPFYWFDLSKNEVTKLRVHPFCYMEANSYYEQKFTPEQAAEELRHYQKLCIEFGGKLITIWHNHFLGTDAQFKGWREMYQQFIDQLHYYPAAYSF